MKLMLAPGKDSPYRRSIFADDGTTRTKQYVFEPQTPIDVDDADLPALADILGGIVVIPKDSPPKELQKADREATAKLAEKLKADKEKVAKKETTALSRAKAAAAEEKPVPHAEHHRSK